jgi:predicted nucleic acid-binding Zn ribbon protein
MADYCIHGKDLTKLTSDPCEECLKQSWLDKQFNESWIWLLISPLIPCATIFILVLSIAGMIGCRDAKARKRAIIAFFGTLFLLIIMVMIRLAIR